MTKRMLIDAAHPEETRVAVVDGHQLEDFDVEVSSRRQLKGNIYLAKVVRVEPSLQAAFVDYGGNRHGFLAFSEIHPDYYQIPVEDRDSDAFDEDEEAIIDVEPVDPEELEVGEDDESDDESDGGEDIEAVEAAEDAAEDDAAPAEGAELDVAEAPEADADPEDHEDKPDGEIAADSAPEPFVAEDAPKEEEAEEDAGEEPEAETAEAEASDDAPEVVEASDENGDDETEAEAAEEDVEVVGGDDESDEVDDTHKRRPNHKQYKIQEVIKRRQVLLVQVVKEERGNKGAALTTYISLAGRYCVLMPNTSRGGGISRKITNSADRKSLKAILSSLDIPPGMAVILRTAGIGRTKAEIKRDFEYLIRLWKNVRDLTLQSTAPTLVHEEGDIVRRSIRDLYTRDIDDVQVEGENAYKAAKEFMKLLIPSHARKIKQYKDASAPLFRSAGVENQLDAIHNPVVNLPSGGYLVINPTEALVSIDVNSGRSTKERNIEETALKTNLEAADEVARQLRLRDLAGLVVIDFIDMDINRNNTQVERRMKEALKHDRARIQVGRISPFGLLEMSRQRLRPSLIETSSEPCPHCGGTGIRRSTESTALVVLRAIDEEGANRRASELTVHVPTSVALYILNHKRDALAELEAKYDMQVILTNDDSLIPPDLRLERTKNLNGETISEMVATVRPESGEDSGRRRRRRRRGRKRGDEVETTETQETVEASDNTDGDEDGEDRKGRRRRRSRRGGRRRRRTQEGAEETADNLEATEAEGADASNDDAEGSEGEEKPRRRRRSRRRKSADAEEGSEAQEASSEDADSESDDGEEKPRRRRRSRRRSRSSDNGDEVQAAEAEGSEEASNDEGSEEKPKRRRTRTRRKKADEGSDDTPKEAPAAEAAAEAAPAPKVETPKVEAKAEAKTEEPKAPVAGVETVVVGEAETKPKRKGWWNLGG